MITCPYMLALACKGEILCILLVFIMHNLRCSTSVVASAGTCDTQKQNKPKHPLPPKQQHILLEPCQVNTTNQCSQQNYSKVQARPTRVVQPELTGDETTVFGFCDNSMREKRLALPQAWNASLVNPTG